MPLHCLELSQAFLSGELFGNLYPKKLCSLWPNNSNSRKKTIQNIHQDFFPIIVCLTGLLTIEGKKKSQEQPKSLALKKKFNYGITSWTGNKTELSKTITQSEMFMIWQWKKSSTELWLPRGLGVVNSTDVHSRTRRRAHTELSFFICSLFSYFFL